MWSTPRQHAHTNATTADRSRLHSPRVCVDGVQVDAVRRGLIRAFFTSFFILHSFFPLNSRAKTHWSFFPETSTSKSFEPLENSDLLPNWSPPVKRAGWISHIPRSRTERQRQDGADPFSVFVLDLKSSNVIWAQTVSDKSAKKRWHLQKPLRASQPIPFSTVPSVTWERWCVFFFSPTDALPFQSTHIHTVSAHSTTRETI